jgi:hypothetical protein
MKAAGFSETFVDLCKTLRRHVPEDAVCRGLVLLQTYARLAVTGQSNEETA